MQHLNENLLCSVKCELTGPDPLRHELIEVAVLPLNHMLQIHPDIPPFNMRLRPQNKEEIDYRACRLSRSEVADAILRAFDRDKVADLFVNWYQSIGQKERKRIIPLAHGWPKERMLFVNWLGYDIFSDLFSEDYRDTLIAAHYINDRQCVKAEPCVFNKQNLSWLAKKLNVEQLYNGTAMSDCLTIAEVYKRQLQLVMP
jgi:DNA polymerase III epsilon subunit-like protein